MKQAIILFALLMAMSTVFAQSKIITVRGTVTDAKSKEPLPGVTVIVQNGGLYSQTNGDGTFVIKLPEKLLGGNLIFSMFGYERDTIAVKEVQKKHNVKIKKGGTVNLKEVVVSEYTPQTLIKEVVSRIPENYWTDTTIGTYFYRDIRQLNDELYIFDEMVFDALRVGYDKHNTITQTHGGDKRFIESDYKAILYSRLLVNDTAYISEITGRKSNFRLSYSDNDVLVDPVEIPNTTGYLSTSKRSLKSWDYKMATFTDPDNIVYYIVTMTKSDSFLGPTEYKVILTIQKSNLALTKLEYYYSSNQNDAPWPLNILNQKAGIDSIYYNDSIVYNYGVVDGKMTLTSYTKHNLASFYYSNDTIHGLREQHFVFDAQCVLTSQRRGDASFFDENNIQSPVRIAVSDRQAGELRYDEEFWDQYNFVPIEEAVLKKLEKKLSKE